MRHWHGKDLQGGTGKRPALDPDQPVTNVQTLADAVAQTMAGRRFNMTLQSALAALAVLLALVGVYGVVAHAAAQRTREIALVDPVWALRRE